MERKRKGPVVVAVEGGAEGLDMLGRAVEAVTASDGQVDATNVWSGSGGDPGYLMYLLAMVDHVRTKARKRDRSGTKKQLVPTEDESIEGAIAELELAWKKMSEAKKTEWRAQASILDEPGTNKSSGSPWGNMLGGSSDSDDGDDLCGSNGSNWSDNIEAGSSEYDTSVYPSNCDTTSEGSGSGSSNVCSSVLSSSSTLRQEGRQAGGKNHPSGRERKKSPEKGGKVKGIRQGKLTQSPQGKEPFDSKDMPAKSDNERWNWGMTSRGSGKGGKMRESSSSDEEKIMHKCNERERERERVAQSKRRDARARFSGESSSLSGEAEESHGKEKSSHDGSCISSRRHGCSSAPSVMTTLFDDHERMSKQRQQQEQQQHQEQQQQQQQNHQQHQQQHQQQVWEQMMALQQQHQQQQQKQVQPQHFGASSPLGGVHGAVHTFHHAHAHQHPQASLARTTHEAHPHHHHHGAGVGDAANFASLLGMASKPLLPPVGFSPLALPAHVPHAATMAPTTAQLAHAASISALMNHQHLLQQGYPYLYHAQQPRDHVDLLAHFRAMAELGVGMRTPTQNHTPQVSRHASMMHTHARQSNAPASLSSDTNSSSSATTGTDLDCEPPQVRTLTLVCDLFSPLKGQVNLGKLAELFEIRKSGYGIVGLSCQYKMEGGQEKVVVRGKVKDAKRHFAHQAQLRLSLPGSPNISVKVFSTGRLQIAGCREESIGASAVRAVAEGMNQVMRLDSTVVQRQVAAGPQIGTPVPGPLDLNALPKADTVMINCSFDAGFSRLGYGLHPLKLTQVLRDEQARNGEIEEVSYTPELHYTGVKVKYRTRNGGASGQRHDEQQSSSPTSKEVFVGVFPSGKAVITGASAWSDVQAAYDFVRKTLINNFVNIRVPVSEITRARKKPRAQAAEESSHDPLQ